MVHILASQAKKVYMENGTLLKVRKFQMHCKPKPCKAYRELPVSQFSQGKTCFHYREPLFSLQGPCFHYKDFPVNPYTSLLGIAVWFNCEQLETEKVISHILRLCFLIRQRKRMLFGKFFLDLSSTC